MYIFPPSVLKTAKVPVDVDPSGLACELEVFLGPNDTTKVATSGRIPFTSTGSGQIISAPVTMPSAGGLAYHVYIDLYVEGYYLVGYQATEDVVIPSGSISPPSWE
jgi:hypothetical protein